MPVEADYLQVMQELCSGQYWKQEEYPCCETIILYMGELDGSHVFCRLAPGNPPGVRHEKDGTWLYSFDEMLDELRRLNYTLDETRHGVLGIESAED